jgi:hypothetical protein
MMEAARTSETLVNFYQTTRRYNPSSKNFPIKWSCGRTSESFTCRRPPKDPHPLRPWWNVTYYRIQKRSPDDEGSKHLWNVGQYIPDYTGQHPRTAIFKAVIFTNSFLNNAMLQSPLDSSCYSAGHEITCNETLKFITAFARALHRILSWVSLTQSYIHTHFLSDPF